MELPNIQAMLVVVGGAIPPVIHTLNHVKPTYICFFVSSATKKSIQDILPGLEVQPTHYEWVETPSPQNLLECYRSLSEELPPILKKWEVTPAQVAIDYTGGTKPMSVAAVLATINESSQYYYVGSVDKTGRTSDGIGVVLNGHEMSFFEANPWIVLAVTARREIALLFNHGRYGPAMEHTRKLADLSPTEMERVYNALADLIEGYVLWDRFKRDQAKIKLNKALGILEAYIADRDDPLRFTITTVRKNVEFLNRLMDNKDPDWERLDTLDLLANAHRRASLAQRYDDAVARLYALLESLARNRLLSQYKIKNNAVQPDQIPEKLRAEFVRRLTDPTAPQKGLRLGLQDSFYLLDEKGDDLGRRYKENEIKINKLLNARNQSRLAHGTQPIDPDVYSQLSTFIMEFIDATPAELPEFPEMRL